MSPPKTGTELRPENVMYFRFHLVRFWPILGNYKITTSKKGHVYFVKHMYEQPPLFSY